MVKEKTILNVLVDKRLKENANNRITMSLETFSKEQTKRLTDTDTQQ